MIKIYKRLNSISEDEHKSANNSYEEEFACSSRCYLKLRNVADLQELRAQKNKFIYPLTVKGIIKMGVQIFTYNPCLIWHLADEGKNPRIIITCDLVFLYFLEEYDLIHKI